ncbi:MAG TPA: L,D-transpeptidase family protein [Terriglobales bacterium]|nr:L,D-transpeptidase family protein [Terriglobales bacterium]
MKRLRVREWDALSWTFAVCVALFFGSGPGSLLHAETSSSGSKASVVRRQELTAQGQAWLGTAIASGSFPDLRWPDFSDYKAQVQKFYESEGNSSPWVEGMEPTPQAREVIALLLRADHKGLSVDDYDGPRWSDRLARLKPATRQPTESDALKFDLALTVCAMRYISDLHNGKVNPKRVAFALDDESKKYDLAAFLRDQVVGARSAADVLSQVEPSYPGYRRTLHALQAYVELAKKDDGEQLPAVKKAVVPGDTYSGVPRLTRLLRLVGDLPANANVSVDPPIYSGALVDAVKNFQRRHGRDPNGRLDAQTLADLNVPLSRRILQMQLTLERWRWMPDSYQRAPIVVNIPEFRLRAYDKDFNIGVTMNVVVGKAYGGHDTPVFTDSMKYVVFRPFWEVPPSIIHGEMIPHITRDPEYLASKGFEVVDSEQNVVSAGTVTPEVLAQLQSGKLFVRQKPGPKNALGLAKFVFPNTYNVYMHDTPSTEFFARSRRDFSHGCIRLERPADLAAWVLRDNPGWTPDRIRAAMNGTTTQQVNLTHPIPVLILYGTVIVLEDGVVRFYDDIYGHDGDLEKVLAKGYPYPQ